MSKPPYYGEYLQLGQILSAQRPVSASAKTPAHDEMLFIIVHQVFELWFKQILYELESTQRIFSAEVVSEDAISKVVARLNRISLIQKLIANQFEIIETMTPLDFLDFRDLLIPASGFQSLQFRILENRLGLKRAEQYQTYLSALSEADAKTVKESLEAPSLLQQVEKWLERIPFLKFEGFDFLSAYRKAVDDMLDRDQKIIEANASLSEVAREFQLKSLKITKENFEALFDPHKHQELVEKGERRLSYQATWAALLIFLYRDQPILHMPFQLLQELIEIDQNFTSWRHRHLMMVQRMIGTKIGTGGSSGAGYLKDTTERYKIFGDFAQMATFLIPRSALPKLPSNLEKQLGFAYG